MPHFPAVAKILCSSGCNEMDFVYTLPTLTARDASALTTVLRPHKISLLTTRTTYQIHQTCLLTHTTTTTWKAPSAPRPQHSVVASRPSSPRSVAAASPPTQAAPPEQAPHPSEAPATLGLSRRRCPTPHPVRTLEAVCIPSGPRFRVRLR